MQQPPQPDASAPADSSSAPPAAQANVPARQPVAARLSDLARLVIGAVVVGAVILTVFCAQNTQGTSVTFLAWSWPGAPLFAVILASVALGIAIGGLFVWLRLLRYSVEHRVPGRRRQRS
jgi:uncharacterized integral membrane protein